MSIQSEITRLNTAKSTLKTWLNEQNVSIDNNANLTEIADTISTLNLGGGNVDALINDLYYKSGDTFIISNGSQRYNVSGMLTSSAKSLSFTVIVPKSLKNISSVSCSILKLNVRGIKGYVGATAWVEAGTNFLDGTTLTVAKVSDNAIGITVAAGASYTNSTNNTPVNVSIENLRLNFN